MTARVGVAVVTYDSAEHVEQALGALPADVLQRTVVVDNASRDATLQVLEPWTGRGVRVEALPVNRGFGAGVNAALAVLRDEVELLLVLNPDAVLLPADLAALVAHLDQHPGCGVVAPRLFRDGEPLPSARRLPGLRHLLWPVAPAPVARLFPDGGLPASRAVAGPVGAVEGACMLFRVDALRRVGGFDEGYFLYLEEADLARRLARLGLTADLSAAARAEHAVGRSRASSPYDAAPHFVTSTLRYLRRWRRWEAGLYVLLARASWALRERLGGLDPGLAAAYRQALRDPRARP